MIINRPRDRRATVLGQPFLAPAAEARVAPQSETNVRIEPFHALVKLQGLCRRTEREIASF